MSQQVRGKQKPDRLSKVHAGCKTASSGFQGLSDNSPEEEVAHGRCHCSTVWTRPQEVPEGTLEFPEALPSQGPPIPGKCTTAESPPPRPREAHPSDCGEPVRQTSPSDSLRLSSGEMRTPPQYDTTICKQRIFTGWKCKSLRIFPSPACKRSGKHSTFPALLCLSSYGIVTLTTGKPGTGQRRRQHNAHFRPTCP